MRFVPWILALSLSGIPFLSDSVWAAIAGPLSALKQPVVEVHFGIRVTDPYRWMEDTQSPATQRYLHSQTDYTRAVLDSLGAPRAALLARLRQLSAAVDRVPVPANYESDTVYPVGSRLFYKKILATDGSAGLYTRSVGADDERLIVPAAKFNHGEGSANIAYFVPSPDGRYIAIGASSGSEVIDIRLVSSDDGGLLEESILTTTSANISWADDRHFVYVKPTVQSAAAVASYVRSGVFLHEVGTDPAKDPQLFGFGYSSAIPFEPNDFAYITCARKAGYLVAAMSYGVENSRRTLYLAPLNGVLRGQAPTWRQVTRTEDEVNDFDVNESTLFVLTHKDSPNREVRAFSMEQSFEDARVVVPSSDRVIETLSAASDGLYIVDQDGTLQHLRRLAYAESSGVREVALPFAGSITVRTTAELPGAVVSDTSWVHSPIWYRVDPSGHITDTHLQAPSPIDFSQIVAEEVFVPSSGGVQVPLSILHLRGMKRNGSPAAWLQGYGAYGGVLSPDFDPTRLAWLERGGVYAVAHVRGGGEYGERWHTNGARAHKQNSIDDFLACARYLVDKKYTQPARLAAVGASAGGMLVAAAMVQGPKTFGAVLSLVGPSDLLRFMQSPNGKYNMSEFGDIGNEGEFKALYAIDPYQHVRERTAYPAVLLTGGELDSRVPVWAPAKMAASLQAATSSAKPVLLSVNFGAGHGLAKSRSAADVQLADEYTFLLWQLGDSEFHAH